MGHKDSERSREQHINDVLHAGRNAAERHGLQPADVDACRVDFAAHMAFPRRWSRWEEFAFSDAWLRACAGNYAINYLKKVLVTAAHETPDAVLASRLLFIVDPVSNPERDLLFTENRRTLNAAIARLNKRQRIAVSLRYYEDGDVSEIALALGVTNTAASKIIGRALISLFGLLSCSTFDSNEALRDFAQSAPPRRIAAEQTFKSAEIGVPENILPNLQNNPSHLVRGGCYISIASGERKPHGNRDHFADIAIASMLREKYGGGFMKIAIGSVMCAFLLTMLGVKGARAQVDFTYTVTSSGFETGEPDSTYTSSGCPPTAFVTVQASAVFSVNNITAYEQTARTEIWAFCGLGGPDGGFPTVFISDPSSYFGVYTQSIPRMSSYSSYDGNCTASGSVGPGSYTGQANISPDDEKTGDGLDYWLPDVPVTVS